MTFLRIQNMFCEFGHVKLTIFRLTIFTVNATYIDTLAKFYPILISITNNDWRTSLAHIFHQWTSIFSWFGGIWSALYLSLNQVFLSWKTFIELIFGHAVCFLGQMLLRKRIDWEMSKSILIHKERGSLLLKFLCVRQDIDKGFL